MNINEIRIKNFEHGDCSFCQTPNTTKVVFNTKCGFGRSLPGFAFVAGFMCDSCMKACQHGYIAGHDAGRIVGHEAGYVAGCEAALKKEQEDSVKGQPPSE